MGIGRFITVEGGEGVGKSTLIQALAQKLRGLGLTVDLTHEPGGTPSADLVRQLFAHPVAGDPWFALSELFLVSAARVQHVRRWLRPRVNRGIWVLCDRFVDSSRVYQGHIGGVSGPILEAIAQYSTEDLKPDLTLLLDCPPEVSCQRIRQHRAAIPSAGASAVDRYDREDLDFHRRVREAFLELAQADCDRFVILNANMSAPDIVDAAFTAIRKRLNIALPPDARGPI